MRLSLAPVFLAGVLSLAAQGVSDPAVAKAQAELERLRALVKLGAAPPAQLERAENAVADARDSAVLSQTLYGNLTEAQADEMMAAAGRRLDRRKRAFGDAKALVDAKTAAPSTLDAPRRELEGAEKEYALAEARAELAVEIAETGRLEAELGRVQPRERLIATGIADHFDGNGVFTTSDLGDIIAAYERQFGKALPVSAQGETATHRALGFDHAGRVDVALQPDSPEGQWLRAFLMLKKVPFFSFRQAVPGKATGAHIHIGPLSGRIASGG